jgi:transposase
VKKRKTWDVEARKALINRLERRELLESDYEILVEMIRNGVSSLGSSGCNHPDSQEQDGNQGSEGEKQGGEHDCGKDKPKAKPRGHGRLGSSDYQGAHDVEVPHPGLNKGDPCPDCGHGRLYEKLPLELINLMASAPIQAVRYLLQYLRCSSCQKTFKADLPEGAVEGKYHPSANAGVVLMKYGLGTPAKRLEKWQKYFGVPLPDATQFEMAEKVANCCRRIFETMESMAADSKLFHLDDTSMIILSLLKENRSLKDGDRYGMNASGILAYHQGHAIYLYYLGRQHAGENLGRLLDKRSPGLGVPLQMGDASSCNPKHDHATLELFCHAHAVRKFKDTKEAFPCESGTILSLFKQVFENDRKTTQMSPQARLDYHRKHSSPLMNQLHTFISDLIAKRRVEPNSSLGKAINYMLKRWQGFTRFLHLPGAPLDNNILERALKQLILLRKNALFFKNDHGAWIGSILSSLLATTTAAGVNPMHYLEAVQIHHHDVHHHPQLWMPWNYRDRLASLTSPQAAA